MQGCRYYNSLSWSVFSSSHRYLENIKIEFLYDAPLWLKWVFSSWIRSICESRFIECDTIRNKEL